MDKLSYALGLGIGRQLAQMGATSLSIDDFATAIKDVLAGAELKVSDQEAQTLFPKELHLAPCRCRRQDAPSF